MSLKNYAVLLFMVFALASSSFASGATNPGDPLFCQPNEGTTFLIVNGGSGIFTVDADCFGNNLNNNTALSITTSQGGTLTSTDHANYTYTPPTSTFTGLDTFSIPVTTVWNSAGGTGSAGGTSQPGGAATLTITLNVLSAAVTLPVNGPTPVPVPAGGVSSCTTPGNPGHGPAATDVVGCVTGITIAGGSTISTLNGTLTKSGATYLYTPNAKFTGKEVFAYQALGTNTDGVSSLDSGNVTVMVSSTAADFTFVTSGTSTQTVNAGSSGNFTFALAPTSGEYPGPVTFAVTGLPAGATATFTPTSVAYGGGAQTVTMAVAVPAATASLRHGLGSHKAPLMLALLLPPIFGSLRKRKLWTALLAGTLLAMMVLAGCGDSKKITPYAITVTATATPNTNGVVQHSTNVTLDVR